MDDTISRRAAIDIVDGWFKRIGLNGDICVDGLRQLPSATDTNVGTKLGTDLAEVGTDCISRRTAIDAFNTNLNELVVGGEENAKTVENYLNRVLDKIKCLPSAQPEPKRGKWILKSYRWECDQCGCLIRRVNPI